VIDEPSTPARVEIVIDISDPSPELLFIWVAARVVQMMEELRRKGIDSELVRIDVDGVRRYLW
jgi:hypothetical protein